MAYTLGNVDGKVRDVIVNRGLEDHSSGCDGGNWRLVGLACGKFDPNGIGLLVLCWMLFWCGEGLGGMKMAQSDAQMVNEVIVWMAVGAMMMPRIQRKMRKGGK